MGADEERSREHESSVPGHPLRQSLEGGTVDVVAIHVVNIAMLYIAVGVDRVPRHRDLWAIENRWLIHIVPDVKVLVGALVLVQCVLLAPILPHFRVGEVGVPRGAGPTPTLEVTHRRVRIGDLPGLPRSLVGGIVDLGLGPFAILLIVPDLGLRRRRVRDLLLLHPICWLDVCNVIHHLPIDLLHKVARVANFPVNVKLFVLLDVRVANVDEFALFRRDGRHHLVGRREVGLVPREVCLPVCVLDVEPYHIVGHVVLVIARIHQRNVLLAHVVPTALMLAQCPQWRQWRMPCEDVELFGNLSRIRSHQDHSIEGAALACPPSLGWPCLGFALLPFKLHEGLRGIDPKEGRGHCRSAAALPTAVDGP
mmetsp:Transcript_31915/g.67877  ORF Transcript_31915/g.67877 Transcript_31915/m.67877 type:complete len:367 (-) Transcript_31915:975-2075(-)